jgi:hypothetical protein
MTIRLHDNQGRDWTVEGDWSAQVVGADFDGRGQILVWISPDSADAHLEPATPEAAKEHLSRLIGSGPPPVLTDGENAS